MKKSLGMPVIGVIAALAIIALVVIFAKATGEPAPTAQNVPDYSKMSPAEVSDAYAKSKAAEKSAMEGKR